ncbi:MAG: AIR synthase-related protein [Candidatus Heimdallarchaeaceae archaeon]
MKEGKLPIHQLNELLALKGGKNEGLVSTGKVGLDVAIIDIEKGKKRALEFYEDNSNILLVEKSDPITFPTPSPGKYSVIVNSNDIVCAGALPFGFLLTIIAPPETTFEELSAIQKQTHEMCEKFNISILGGHTEISSSTNTIIISGHMLGFVPENYLVPNSLSVGDVIIIVGYSAKEGTGIIVSEAEDLLSQILSETEIQEGKELGSDISIFNIALSLNKKFHPKLLHDPTEGGIFGALYEIVASRDVGIELHSLPPLAEVTKKLSDWLEFNPYRLIASGGLIVGIEKDKAENVIAYLEEKGIPAKIIGTVTEEKGKLLYQGKELEEPRGDEIITALKNLEKKRDKHEQ